MSIINARKAFEVGLDGAATVSAAKMQYEQGGRVQKFTFVVKGAPVVVELGPRDDIEASMIAAGAEHKASINP